MTTLDPRAENRRTADGEGPRWELIRGEVLDRDEHTCQRCGYRPDSTGVGDASDIEEGSRRLEAHHAAPHTTPSLEALEEFVTLCGPCHATLHPDDPAYGDRQEEATLFPLPDAPRAVSTMRSDRQHVCQRCQHVAQSATELAAYVEAGQEYVLCKPCAGALLEAGYDPDDFEAAGDVDVEALTARSAEAPVRPAMLASGPVRASRPPKTTAERLVADTPLRYLLNPIGLTLFFILLGVAFSFYAF
jgi:hypothetical protein